MPFGATEAGSPLAAGRARASWQRLVEPTDALRDPGARQRMRTLSALLLPVLPFALGATMFADPRARPIFAAATALIIVAWWLSRTRHATAAGLCAVAACLVVPYAGFLTEAATTSATAELMWLVIAVVLAGLALSPPQVAVAGVANLGLTLGALSSNPGIPLGAAVETTLYVGLVTLLVVLHARVRARNMARLQNQTAFSDGVIDAMGNALFVADARGRVKTANPALGRALGVDPARLVGLPASELFEPGAAPDLRLLEPTSLDDVALKPAAGPAVPVALHLAPVPSRAGPRGEVVGVAVDLRAARELIETRAAAAAHQAKARELEEAHQRLVEAQDQLVQAGKLAAVGEMAAGVAHEINNPLTGVMLAAGLLRTQLQAGDATPGSAGLADQIIDAVERCKGIIDGLLEFGRRTSGEKVAFDLREVFRTALELVRHRLTEREVTVSVDLEEALPVVGDANQLTQIAVNLLLNAADATERCGRIAVTGRVAAGRVHVSVADDGPGVPAALRDRIFDPFFTTKPPGYGTGLGLSVSYGIASEHGGELRLDSPGSDSDVGLGGACFSVELPAGSPPTTEESSCPS